MEWSIVIILSVLSAVCWQFVAYVLPAMRNAVIAENMLTLTTCLLELNTNALSSGKIKSGSYLHDKFYRFLVLILCNADIRLPTTGPDHDSKRLMQQFDDEINRLGFKTKRSVTDAISAASKILFAKHPVDFIVLFLRTNRKKTDYRNGLIVSGKYVTVNL